MPFFYARFVENSIEQPENLYKVWELDDFTCFSDYLEMSYAVTIAEIAEDLKRSPYSVYIKLCEYLDSLIEYQEYIPNRGGKSLHEYSYLITRRVDDEPYDIPIEDVFDLDLLPRPSSFYY